MPNALIHDHAVGADRSQHDPVDAALTALRTTAQELAARGDTPPSAGAQLNAAIRGTGQGSSAQQLLEVYAAVYQARDAARMAIRPARYDREQWAEVSRLAGECLKAAVQAMRARLKDERAVAVMLPESTYAVPGAQ